MFDRLKLITNDKLLNAFKNTKILLVGVGGVGGYAVESLIRSGIENIILVDFDTIDITNLNRQIITNQKNINQYKTDETEKRILSINPNCKVKKITKKLELDNIEELFQNKIDYLIDACDTIIIKQELIKRCLE